MQLKISLDTVCRLIARARELEREAANVDDDDEEDIEDANEDEDGFGPLGTGVDSDAEQEIRTFLEDLLDEEVTEILALALVGRGTYDIGEWEEANEEAIEGGSDEAIEELLDMPTLAAHLEAGLAAFDLNCQGSAALD